MSMNLGPSKTKDEIQNKLPKNLSGKPHGERNAESNDFIIKNDILTKDAIIFIQKRKPKKDLTNKENTFPYDSKGKKNILYYIYIYIYILPIITTNSIEENHHYEIRIKIQKNGTQKILSSGCINLYDSSPQIPDSLIINGIPFRFPNSFPYEIHFNGENNEIILTWHSEINTCGCLFHQCDAITEIDLSNFDTSNVEIFSGMFIGCSSLTSINFQNFKTTNAKAMDWMFSGCSALRELDISMFYMSEVDNMCGMFSGCSSLVSLDLSNLDTSKVIHMQNLFDYCSELKEINLKNNFITSSVESMRDMFRECKSLEVLDLSNFSTSKVIHFGGMFNGCSSLISLDLKNFQTPKAEYMEYMFNACHKLEYLDISNFNTENVINMRIMFGYCKKLNSLDLSNFNVEEVYDIGWMFVESLDLSNFNVENVYDMAGMFVECENLVSLNLSSFNTKSVNMTDYTFAGCLKLKYLDIANFETSKVVNMDHMFHNCPSLTYLDLKHFDTSSVTLMFNMFSHCFELTSINLESFDTSSVKDMQFMFCECHKLLSLNLNNFDTKQVVNMSYMFRGCVGLKTLNIKFDTNSVETMKHMFRNCMNLESLDLSSFDTSKVTEMENMFENSFNLKYLNIKKVTIQENTTINQIIDKNIKNTIICMEDSQSFDKIISIYNWSLINCTNWGVKMTEDKSAKCKNGILITEYDNNCFQICSYYFYFDESKKKYICTDKPQCPKELSKLIHDKGECVKNCLDTENKLEYNNNCLKECPKNFKLLKEKGNKCNPECPKDTPFLFLDTLLCTDSCSIIQRQRNLCVANYIPKKEDNFNILDLVINQTRNELFNHFDIEVVNGLPIKEKGASIIIKKTTDKNENDNDIDLSECEEILIEKLNLNNDSFYLFRIDIEQERMAVPSFEYELLYLNNENNLEKVNMALCKEVKVKIDIPFNLTDDLEKYNTSSPYYNDICYVTDSEDGTDISLSDRKQDYYNNNMSICETGCDFVSYNTETQKAVCSCGIKTEIPFLDNVNIDKDLLMNSFMDINNIANTKMMKCFRTVFNKKAIIKNIGCFIFLVLIVANCICLIMLLIKYYNLLHKKIEKIKIVILDNINNRNNINITTNQRIKTKRIRKNNKNNFSNNKSSKRQIKSISNNKIDKNKIYGEQPIRSIKLKQSKNNKHSPPKNKNNKNIIQIKELNINNNNKNKSSLNKKKSINNNADKKDNKIKKGNLALLNNKANKKNQTVLKNKLVFKLTGGEINNLEYEEAIIKDKRTFLEYYFSLLKVNHPVLFIFNNEDYNSPVIKLSILFFTIGSNITVNSLFFNDATMHKIYTDKGSYNFIYQLPQIIYSTIISAVLNGIIKVLGLSEKRILNFKKINTNKYELDKKHNNLLKILKIKFGLFYLLVLSLLFLFWYYVSCFCGIYRNTQIHLIKDSLLSYATSLVTPFGIYLLPGFFRKSKYLYKFSKFLQIF